MKHETIIEGPAAGARTADQRGEDCCQALRPGYQKLLEAATAAGWGGAESVVALLNIITDNILENAGAGAVVETLEEALVVFRNIARQKGVGR